MTKSAHDRMRQGYAQSKPPPVTAPAPFRPVAEMERLRRLRRTDPATFDAKFGGQRLALAMYEWSRQLANYTPEEDDHHGDDAA